MVERPLSNFGSPTVRTLRKVLGSIPSPSILLMLRDMTKNFFFFSPAPRSAHAQHGRRNGSLNGRQDVDCEQLRNVHGCGRQSDCVSRRPRHAVAPRAWGERWGYPLVLNRVTDRSLSGPGYVRRFSAVTFYDSRIRPRFIAGAGPCQRTHYGMQTAGWHPKGALVSTTRDALLCFPPGISAASKA